MRDNEDITKDQEALAKDLEKALQRKLSNVQKDKTRTILEIFDSVKLQCWKYWLEKFITISQKEK